MQKAIPLSISVLSVLLISCSTDSSPNYMGKNHKTTTKITLDEAQADLQSLLVSVDAENSRSYAQSSRSEVEGKTGEEDYFQYNLKTVVGIRK